MVNWGGTRQPVRIAVDAMGGDYAPQEIVKGAVEASRKLGVAVALVGVPAEIERELGKSDTSDLPIRLVEAVDLIGEGEEPAFAVFRKPNCPVAVAARLVKEGEADAMVSAGSTGAAMVAALQYVGTLPGMDRPMAGGPFLGLAPKTVVVDLGANVGCQPYQLVDFAAAGTVYARIFLGVQQPTVALLNVGAEEGKGDDLAKEAYPLLKKSGLNFVGNVEGMDVAMGKVNVVVCDGFVGNILVKFCEGLGRAIGQWLAGELRETAAADGGDRVSDRLMRLMSPATVLGGGPLLGVNGVVSVAHGASHASQIVGTIENTKLALESDFVGKIKAELEKAQAGTGQ